VGLTDARLVGLLETVASEALVAVTFRSSGL